MTQYTYHFCKFHSVPNTVCGIENYKIPHHSQCRVNYGHMIQMWYYVQLCVT